MKAALKIVTWILLVGGATLLLAFTNKTESNMLCKEVFISINNDEENFFVNEKDILQMVYQRGDSLKGQPMNVINVYGLESIINTHPSIQNTEVYKSVNGEIYINVKQRRPIARIINYKGEGFYFDNFGKIMPLSENYSARVPVFTGEIPFSFSANYNRNFQEEFLSEDSLNMNIHLMSSMFHLAAYIDSSEFWRAQIEQIIVQTNDFVLIPKVGNNKIIFGDSKNVKKKFEKLMTFYLEGLSKTGWNKYSIINLKFENQVVCTKSEEELIASSSKNYISPIAEANPILTKNNSLQVKSEKLKTDTTDNSVSKTSKQKIEKKIRKEKSKRNKNNSIKRNKRTKHE